MKRIFDLFFSLVGVVFLSPIIFIALLLVWIEDKNNPFYFAKRVGKNGKNFKMIKVRTMIINADKSGVDSTSLNDKRITNIGKLIRSYKIDEIPQLINILLGQMSIVGPRPNDIRDTAIYTKVERKLLKVKPGLTDFASIVFSDESEILAYENDPDLAYNQLIRPTKSSLALFYISRKGIIVDIIIIIITFINLISRKTALRLLNKLLKVLGAPEKLIEISSRKYPLLASPPPGADKIVKSRKQ